MNIFPLYILKLDDTKVVLPDGKEDMGHSDFWEKAVSHVIARYYRIPQAKLLNLPYCQRRARVVGDKCYYGERTTPELLDLVRKEVGNERLAFVFDDHEKRLREEVIQFRRLVRRYRPKPTGR
jgi:predicted Zn-dependent protease